MGGSIFLFIFSNGRELLQREGEFRKKLEGKWEEHLRREEDRQKWWERWQKERVTERRRKKIEESK